MNFEGKIGLVSQDNVHIVTNEESLKVTSDFQLFLEFFRKNLFRNLLKLLPKFPIKHPNPKEKFLKYKIKYPKHRTHLKELFLINFHWKFIGKINIEKIIKRELHFMMWKNGCHINANQLKSLCFIYPRTWVNYPLICLSVS